MKRHLQCAERQESHENPFPQTKTSQKTLPFTILRKNKLYNCITKIHRTDWHRRLCVGTRACRVSCKDGARTCSGLRLLLHPFLVEEEDLCSHCHAMGSLVVHHHQHHLQQQQPLLSQPKSTERGRSGLRNGYGKHKQGHVNNPQAQESHNRTCRHAGEKTLLKKHLEKNNSRKSTWNNIFPKNWSQKTIPEKCRRHAPEKKLRCNMVQAPPPKKKWRLSSHDFLCAFERKDGLRHCFYCSLSHWTTFGSDSPAKSRSRACVAILVTASLLQRSRPMISTNCLFLGGHLQI